jgi:hypothetical protein
VVLEENEKKAEVIRNIQRFTASTHIFHRHKMPIKEYLYVALSTHSTTVFSREQCRMSLECCMQVAGFAGFAGFAGSRFLQFLFSTPDRISFLILLSSLCHYTTIVQ